MFPLHICSLFIVYFPDDGTFRVDVTCSALSKLHVVTLSHRIGHDYPRLVKNSQGRLVVVDDINQLTVHLFTPVPFTSFGDHRSSGIRWCSLDFPFFIHHGGKDSSAWYREHVDLVPFSCHVFILVPLNCTNYYQTAKLRQFRRFSDDFEKSTWVLECAGNLRWFLDQEPCKSCTVGLSWPLDN